MLLFLSLRHHCLKQHELAALGFSHFEKGLDHRGYDPTRPAQVI